MTRTEPRASAKTTLRCPPLYTRLKPQTRPRSSDAPRSESRKPGFARFDEKPVRLVITSSPLTGPQLMCASRIQPPVKVVSSSSPSARSRL